MRSAVSYRDRRHPLLRAFNRAGRPLLGTPLPWIDLDEERLLAAAKRRAAYGDFGPDDFAEPFRVLLAAAREEGRLTHSGRMVTREVVLAGLVARLSMRREIAEHPEIPAQPVRRPLIVVGMPRSGTSLLHHLLALDPRGRPLVAWETISPAPVGIGPLRVDLRIPITRFLVWISKTLLAPETAGMHKYTYDGPAECTSLLWPSFVWPMGMVLPSVRRWINGVQDSTYDFAYGEYRLALQMLHWQRPARDHWVLKSPQHIWAMDALARAVPEATIIQTHRNMNSVLPSLCSLSAAIMSMYTDTIRTERMGPDAMAIARESVDRVLRARERIEAGRISDVRYPDLVADPVSTVRRIYDTHGYAFTPGYETRMRQWLERDRKAPRPVHSYAHERFGLDCGSISEAFADYHRRYGIEE